MTNAIRDNNHVPVLHGVSALDGSTLVPIQIDAANGGFKTDTSTTIGFTPGNIALRDENHVPVLMGVDSVSGDPIPVFVHPTTGAILVSN